MTQGGSTHPWLKSVLVKLPNTSSAIPSHPPGIPSVAESAAPRADEPRLGRRDGEHEGDAVAGDDDGTVLVLLEGDDQALVRGDAGAV